MHTKEKRSALEVVMTVLHAGGKFDKDSYKVSGGLHGVGVSCVNALSKDLHVTVRREGKTFEQEYKIGVPQYPVREIGPADKTGTTVHFWPDDSIFSVTVFNKDILESRLRELSYLNKKITIILSDLREKDENGKTYSKTFYSEGGIVEFVEMIDKNANRQPLIPSPIFCEVHDLPTNVAVEVAMIYNASYQEHIFSYVNNINTIEGGTHVAGFRRSITRVFKSYGEKQGMFEKAKVEIEGDDFREGLSAIISIKVPEPQFEGQTKTKLGNNEVMGIVDSTLSRWRLTWKKIPGKPNKLSIRSSWRHRQGRQPVKRGKWFNAKVFCQAADYPVSWRTVRTRTRKNVSCSW
jgi:DNA gyrase subunit B